jgi:hypothetical protein
MAGRPAPKSAVTPPTRGNLAGIFPDEPLHKGPRLGKVGVFSYQGG